MTTTTDFRDALVAAYDAVERPWSSESFAGLMDDLIAAAQQEARAGLVVLASTWVAFAHGYAHQPDWHSESDWRECQSFPCNEAIAALAATQTSTHPTPPPADESAEGLRALVVMGDELVEQATTGQMHPVEALDMLNRAIKSLPGALAPTPPTDEALRALVEAQFAAHQLASHHGHPKDCQQEQCARWLALAAARTGPTLDVEALAEALIAFGLPLAGDYLTSHPDRHPELAAAYQAALARRGSEG